MVLAVLVQKNLVFFKWSFLVHLSYWNTPSIENGLLRQPEFLDWQKALFSFLVSLSALIEFSCHRLKPDAKQGCWPPCMCLSLSTVILTGQSGDVRNQRWREREMDRKNKRNKKNEEREQLFCSYNELLIHHEVSAEKTKTLQSSSLILCWWSQTGLFPVPNILHDRLSIYTAGLADPPLLLSGPGKGILSATSKKIVSISSHGGC